METKVRRYMMPISLGAVLVVLAALPMMGLPQVWLLYLFFFFVYLAVANMWNLLAGFSGLLVLCPAAFVGLAGYSMTILTWLGVPFYVGIIVGGISAAIFAMVISPPLFRMRGIYFAIGTLIVPEIMRLVFLRWRPVGGELHGGGAGYIIKGVRGMTTGHAYWLALAIGIVSIIVVRIILRSKFGLGLAAIRDNDVTAASSGIDVFRLKLSSFVIGAFIMGIAGAIFYAREGYIEPSAGFHINWLMTALLATVIGGEGIEEGPLVGAIIVVILHFQLARYGELSLLIQGIILVIIMLAVPQGITGLVRDLRKGGGLRSLRKLTQQRIKAIASPRDD